MKKTIKFLALIFSISLFFSCKPPANKGVYLFSYFKNNGEDGLHLAYSYDGYSWKALRNDSSFLAPTVSKDSLMRDPCIVQGVDGKFHMVWTVSWNEKGIGYANSPDLINWSEQQYIPVMEHEPKARNCWAPEIVYDKQEQSYMIYWATTIPGRFAEGDSSCESGYNHRMYYTLTKDFKDFSETKVLYDQGFSVIDAVIRKYNDTYFMFLKDETKFPTPEKNLKIATSPYLTHSYSEPSVPITKEGLWVEGPTVHQIGNATIIYFDIYRKHKMGAIRSTNLEDWTDISDSISFPDGTRHGTVFKVPEKTLNTLLGSE
jgi:predicted GH43/DUF377 family glycosyl hydrolase